MGSFSSHSIRISKLDKQNFSKEKNEIIAKSFEEFLKLINEENFIKKDEIDLDLIYSGESKWYEREVDLQNFSEENPGILITLDIDYEEDLPDRVYFLNGKLKKYKAIIHYNDKNYINEIT